MRPFPPDGGRPAITVACTVTSGLTRKRQEYSMYDRCPHILVADALAGRITRRQTLSLGLRLGVASPVIAAILAASPEDSRASAPQTAPARLPAAQEGSGVLTVVIPSGFSDLDPQYAYDNLSSMFFLATYEMLLQDRKS